MPQELSSPVLTNWYILSLKDTIEIYTDGACRGNPGPGGWGVLMRCNGIEKELYGGEYNTTNNRMELMAAIKGLETLPRARHVCLTTDSVYVKNGITQWITNWKKRNWRTSNKKLVKNVDLWRKLDEVSFQHEIDWRWVKGHSDHEGNERADVLANKGIDESL